MPEFKTRDSSGAAFWDERFQQAFMPWDRAGVPVALSEFVRHAPAPMTTLIPGCGVGYEVALLAESGWDVCAIDFSPVAVKAARQNLGALGEYVVEADFFTFEPPRTLDLIYERAFLCALPPAMRAAIAPRWAALLPAGALLAGYFFIDATRGGPPFGIEAEQLKTLLETNFECLEDRAVQDSIAVFAGKERWQVWRRLP
ncbi:MAG TPA: methyltransferase [Burkholderiaceae bacterium]|nr:methyltransferase [Burkholderiaceae bacterium]